MTGKKAAATLSNAAKQIIASKGGPLPQSGKEEHSRLVRLLNDIHARSSIKSSRTALLTLATGTFVTLNSPSALRSLWEWSGKSRSDALLMRESALKSISFIGIAKVINNLAVLHECFTKSGIQDSLPSKSRRYARVWDNIQWVLRLTPIAQRHVGRKHGTDLPPRTGTLELDIHPAFR